MTETIVAIQSIPQIYLFLSQCFSYPTEDFYEAMRGTEALEELGALIEGLPFKVNFKGIPSPSLPHEELESEHINIFDIEPSCPLYESAYEREDMNRRDILEELLRFYEHFDIKLSNKERDFPDHLVAELEFMAFLVKKEADAIERGKAPEPYRLAQLDFLERHMDKWVHKLNERIHNRVKEPFYKGASAFMVTFLEGHLLYLSIP